jgi:hypothetical protein
MMLIIFFHGWWEKKVAELDKEKQYLEVITDVRITGCCSPGSFNCQCGVGYDLYAENGTAGFFIENGETGLRDGDLYRLNKTCVPKMCPKLAAPENGVMLTVEVNHHCPKLSKS